MKGKGFFRNSEEPFFRTAKLFFDLDWMYAKIKKYKINKMAFSLTLDPIFFGCAGHIGIIQIKK
jgi:hypothetical protein